MTKREAFVIITPGFASNEYDTVCLPMQQDLANTLSQIRSGMDVVILALQYPYRRSMYPWKQCTVYSFDGRNRGGLRKLIIRRQVRDRFAKLKTEFSIKAVLSFWYGECAWIGAALEKEFDIPHKCWILGQDARAFNHYPARLKLPPSRLIALSDALQGEFESAHKLRPSFVIPPGIDPAKYPEPLVAPMIDIIGVGSLIELKRFDLFIRLVSQLRMTMPALTAVLIGKGPELKRLTGMVAKLNLEANISLLGELPHADVLQHMRKARVLVHPSDYEGFSGVCQESLAAGCNVVSFTQPMKHEIDRWYVVPDFQAMMNTVESLLRDKNNLRRSSRPYLVETTAAEILSCFGIHVSAYA